MWLQCVTLCFGVSSLALTATIHVKWRVSSSQREKERASFVVVAAAVAVIVAPLRITVCLFFAEHPLNVAKCSALLRTLVLVLLLFSFRERERERAAT